MISVVLPLYNAARVVGEQLDALAGQTYSGAWELIVADNGSTDGGGPAATGGFPGDPPARRPAR